jgi:hypothetical protein
MNKVISPYYPPRARWYRPGWRFGAAVRRRLHLDRLRPPGPISVRAFLCGLLVPGLAFGARGARLWGRVAVAASGLLAGLFFVWLGYPAGNVAFGLLLSLHSTGVAFLCEPWLAGARLRTRVFFSLATLLALGGLVYMPLRHLLQERYCLPMNVAGRVVVVSTRASAASVQRGDWIAYSIGAEGDHGVYVSAGYGLGPVLAVGGDRVRFGPNGIEINGVSAPRRDHMPAAGEWVVPQNCWFVWPEVDISGHGNVGAAVLSERLLRMATVTPAQFVGKPFQRWFWRRQLHS